MDSQASNGQSLLSINALNAFVSPASFQQLPITDNISEYLAKQSAAQLAPSDLAKNRGRSIISRLAGDLNLKPEEAAVYTLEQMSAVRPDLLPTLIGNHHWRLVAGVCRQRLIDFPRQLLSVTSGIRDCMNLWYIRIVAIVQLGFYGVASKELETLIGDATPPQRGSGLDPLTYKPLVDAMLPSPAFPEEAKLDWETAFVATDSLVLWELEWLKIAIPTMAQNSNSRAELYSALSQSYSLMARCQKIQKKLAGAASARLTAKRLEHHTNLLKSRELRLHAFIASVLIQVQQPKSAFNLLQGLINRLGDQGSQSKPLFLRLAQIELHGILLRTLLFLADIEQAHLCMRSMEHLQKRLQIEHPNATTVSVVQYLQSHQSLLAFYGEDYSQSSSQLTELLKSSASCNRLDAIGVNNFALLQLQLGNAGKAEQVLLRSYIEKHPLAVLAKGEEGGQTVLYNAVSLLDLTIGRPERVLDARRQLLWTANEAARSRGPQSLSERRSALGLVGEYANEGFNISKLLLSTTASSSECPAI